MKWKHDRAHLAICCHVCAISAEGLLLAGLSPAHSNRFAQNHQCRTNMYIERHQDFRMQASGREVEHARAVDLRTTSNSSWRRLSRSGARIFRTCAAAAGVAQLLKESSTVTAFGGWDGLTGAESCIARMQHNLSRWFMAEQQVVSGTSRGTTGDKGLDR